MEPPAHTRVKVCCMKSIEEVWMAIEAGASAIGLVSPMPSGPGPISNEKAAEIAAQGPPRVDAFLLPPLQTGGGLGGQNRGGEGRTPPLVGELAAGGAGAAA